MIKDDGTIATIKKQISECPILIYMKGSPDFPQCGFSARAVQILAECGREFSYVDVLQNQNIRRELPAYSNWPTFPQLYVDGELIGGSDIIAEIHAQGKLKEKLEQAVNKSSNTNSG